MNKLILKQQRVAIKQQVSVAVQLNEKYLTAQQTANERIRNDAVSLKEMKSDLEKKSHQEALSSFIAQKKDEIDECLLMLKADHDKINLEFDEIDNIARVISFQVSFPSVL